MPKPSAARATAERQQQQIHREDVQATETSSNATREVSGEELRARVAVAAYLRAENRGFAPGYDIDDWLIAETEIMTRLGLTIREIN